MIRLSRLLKRAAAVAAGLGLAGSLLAGCASGSGTSAAGSHPSTSLAPESPLASAPEDVQGTELFARLGDIDEYVYSLAVSGETTTVQWHSATNYQFTVSPGNVVTRIVGQDAWVKSGSTWTHIQAPQNADSLDEFAKQVQGLTNVTGVTIKRSGACSSAGRSGTQYTLHTLAGVSSVVCVDAASGVLLRLRLNDSSSSAMSEDVTLISYGNVPAFAAPAG